MLIKQLNALKDFEGKLPSGPGIYKMIGSDKQILYIGKAKNLKVRLKYYQNPTALSKRTSVMLSQLKKIEIIETASEIEAILLEANLIQKYQPKYNILLKDDKTFTYICLEERARYPRMFLNRGQPAKGNYYCGPFLSAQVAKQIVFIVQHLFRIRTCTDSYFAARKKPCILYQMNRCSAPCVEKVDMHDYKKSIRQAKNFLKGKTQKVKRELASEMHAASKNMEYEKANAIKLKLRLLDSLERQSWVLVLCIVLQAILIGF